VLPVLLMSLMFQRILMNQMFQKILMFLTRKV
jgi:hypothetical protein